MTNDERTDSLRVLRSIAEIEGMRDHWARLQWHPNSDIDFYRIVLESLPGIVSPYVLVCSRGGVPAVILVGKVEASRLNVRVGYWTAPGPQIRNLVFIHGGLLGTPTAQECDLLVRQIVNSLRDGEADIARFNHLRTDDPLYACFNHSSRLYNRGFFNLPQMHLAMSLPKSGSDFWAGFSGKMRRKLQQRMRKFERDFTVNIRNHCLASLAEFDGMISDMERVAAKTYQRGLNAGFDASVAGRARMRLKAEKGWLRAYVLYVSGEPCAFFCGTLYQGVLHGDAMGYDPAYSSYSPGTYLILNILEGLCGERDSSGVFALDFGLGNAEYKHYFANQQWWDGSPCRFAPTLRGAILNAYRTSLLFADWWGRKLLNNDLQRKAKRMWRNLLTPSRAEVAL